MSLQLAQTWVASAFRGRQSAQDAMNLFEQAQADGVEATLVMAPELMNNGKCCLAHWTGHELVILELAHKQQQAFGIEPNTMIQELEPLAQPRELPPIRHVNLSDVRIDNCRQHNFHRPLTGMFTYDMTGARNGPPLQCALRVRYFHPRGLCRVTGSFNGKLSPPRGELAFSFDPPAGGHNPDPWRGPLVLFFQLVAAQSWTVLTTSQRISNVLVRVIEAA
jgi:hypothetical protein